LEQNFSVVSFFKMKNLQKISACGTYTYGLYCYHLFSIFITLKCLETLTWTPNAKFCASIFLSFASSLLISYLSYEFFEKRFLAFKNRFI